MQDPVKDPDTRELLRHLWAAKAVKIDLRPEGGFTLAHHQTNPTAPRSPVYVNLRQSDNKNGPLSPLHVDMIARALEKKSRQAQIAFNGICGIPNAGVPLAKSMRKEVYYAQNFDVPTVALEKAEEAGVRMGGTLVSASGLPRGSTILLIDDTITQATSKVWPVEVLRRENFIVEDCLVFLDRQEKKRRRRTRQACPAAPQRRGTVGDAHALLPPRAALIRELPRARLAPGV